MSTQDTSRPGPAFHTAPEVARCMRIDESTLYRHLRNGTFPALKIGGRYVVPAVVLERLIADVLATGRCVDLAEWTAHWRQEQVAVPWAHAQQFAPGGAA